MIEKEQIKALIELNKKIIELLDDVESEKDVESVAEARGIAMGIVGWLAAYDIKPEKNK